MLKLLNLEGKKHTFQAREPQLEDVLKLELLMELRVVYSDDAHVAGKETTHVQLEERRERLLLREVTGSPQDYLSGVKYFTFIIYIAYSLQNYNTIYSIIYICILYMVYILRYIIYTYYVIFV